MEERELSVAMCTYNGAKHLQAQLDSIAAQTRLPDELVVFDDRSTDETVAIIEQFACEAPFEVRLEINESNVGSTKNFERVISKCRGEIIALADQDDVWLVNKLDVVSTVFLARPSVGAVFSDAEVVDENQVPLGFRLSASVGFTPTLQKGISNGRSTQVLLNHNVVTGATMAFRRKFRDLILPISEKWIHDGWIALLVSTVGDLAFIREPLIRYRKHARQQTGPGAVSLADRLVRAKRTGASEYYALAEQFVSVRERLLAVDDDSCFQTVIPLLDMKIKHLRARAEMDAHANRAWRLPRIAEELLSRRYHDYSEGWKSAVKDFLL